MHKYFLRAPHCSFLNFHDVSTTGSVSVHVNANRQGNDGSNDNWADFAVSWWVLSTD